jgi:hypothetical protein
MLDPKPDDEASDGPQDGPGPPGSSGRVTDDYLDEQECESFPASDPHSDWAGPPAS